MQKESKFKLKIFLFFSREHCNFGSSNKQMDLIRGLELKDITGRNNFLWKKGERAREGENRRCDHCEAEREGKRNKYEITAQSCPLNEPCNSEK